MNESIKKIKDKILNSIEIDSILKNHKVNLDKNTFDLSYTKSKKRGKLSIISLCLIPYLIGCSTYLLAIKNLNILSILFVLIFPMIIIMTFIREYSDSLIVKSTLKHEDFLLLAKIITKEELKEITLYYEKLNTPPVSENTSPSLNVMEKDSQYVLNLKDLLDYNYKKEENIKRIELAEEMSAEEKRDKYMDSLYK